MKLFNGRPMDLPERLPKEQRVYAFLDGLDIPYSRVDHEAADTMELCLDIEKTLGAPICKNLLLCNRQCTAFYLLLMPGEKNFRTSVLSKEIGTARLSFASGEYMEKFLDITPGSLSVLGLMNDGERVVQLLIDEDVLRQEYFGCHPCINTSSLKLKTDDVMQKILSALGYTPRIVRLPWQTE